MSAMTDPIVPRPADSPERERERARAVLAGKGSKSTPLPDKEASDGA